MILLVTIGLLAKTEIVKALRDSWAKFDKKLQKQQWRKAEITGHR